MTYTVDYYAAPTYDMMGEVPPQKRYGVALGRHARNIVHIIDGEGALCRLPDAVDASIDFAGLTQYLHEATAEARRMTRDRGFREPDQLVGWCPPAPPGELLEQVPDGDGLGAVRAGRPSPTRVSQVRQSVQRPGPSRRRWHMGDAR